MSELRTEHWYITDSKLIPQIKARIEDEFQTRIHPAEKTRYELFDNFQWDLWHSNTLVYRIKQQYYLKTTNGEVPETSTVKTPKFWWDFPEGEFQLSLKTAIGLWALSPICQIHLQTSSIDVMNSDEKTVARLRITEHIQQDGENSQYYLTLLPLRGYDKQLKTVKNACKPFLEERIEELSLANLIKMQDIKIKPKPNKSFGITPTSPTEEVVRKMLEQMVDQARLYEEGTLEDRDTEFLHQYRVSLRKARSLVNLMKQALPDDAHSDLKIKLARMASPTNNQRDLDVFLLNRKSYEALLPPNFEAGLTELFEHFKKERDSSFRKVKRFFSSKEYQDLAPEVKTKICQTPSCEKAQAKQAIETVAKKRILKRYHKICLLGSEITDATPDEEVHELRIECKKLRYLIEFFAELFPKKRISNLAKSLKKLQTILGNFNDYSVQKDFLAAHIDNTSSQDMIAAINGLIAILHQKQLQERARVCTAFSEFGSEQISIEFSNLFSHQEK